MSFCGASLVCLDFPLLTAEGALGAVPNIIWGLLISIS